MLKLIWRSFFFKMAIGLVAAFLFLGVASITQTRVMMHGLFSEQQEKRGISIANMLAARAANLILVHNYYDLHELVKDAQATNDDVRYIFVLNNGNELLAHSFSGGFPNDLLNISNPVIPEKHRISVLSTEEGIVRDIAVPIFDGRLGVVHVGLSDAGLQAVLNDTTRQIMLDTVLAIVIGLGFILFITGRLTRPIRELVRVTNAMTAGDFTQRAQIKTGDEFSKLADAFNNMADRIYELLSARTHLLQKVITAQEEERKRIARELHDQAGQALTSLVMGLKCLADTCASLDRQCQIEEMRATVKQTLGEIHQLAVELRPSVLDDMGLIPALEKYVSEYRDKFQLDVDFHVQWKGDDRLARETEVAAYRIVQEALTNIVKYANAQNVSVIVTRDEKELTAIVEDDGVGFEADKLMSDSAGGTKLGLYGMRERAMLVGGVLTIESSPSLGTTIYVKIPCARR